MTIINAKVLIGIILGIAIEKTFNQKENTNEIQWNQNSSQERADDITEARPRDNVCSRNCWDSSWNCNGMPSDDETGINSESNAAEEGRFRESS